MLFPLHPPWQRHLIILILITPQASWEDSGIILALHSCFQIIICSALCLWGTWHLVTYQWLPFLSLSLSTFFLCPLLIINVDMWLTAFLSSPSLATILGGSMTMWKTHSQPNFTVPYHAQLQWPSKPLYFLDLSSFWIILIHNIKLQHLILWQQFPRLSNHSAFSCTYS